jgi:hypothetical protein
MVSIAFITLLSVPSLLPSPSPRAVYGMEPCRKLKDRCEHVCAKPYGAQCIVVVDNTEIELEDGHVRITLACFEHQALSTVVCMELRGASCSRS